MQMSTKKLCGSLIPVICGVLLVLLFIVFASKQAEIVSATVESSVRYVSVIGTDNANDCSVSTNPCRTIQYAIGAAQDSDEIRVAAGIYTGTMVTQLDPDVVTATVIISKNISALLGGYSYDFTSRDIDNNQTIISARGVPLSFVLFITNSSPIVDGFTITGARRECNPLCPYHWGGGVFIYDGAPTISHNHIQDNVASSWGGGIRVDTNGQTNIIENTIYSNSTTLVPGFSQGFGGGIFLVRGTTIISGNVIISNTAQLAGGGIFVEWNTPASIMFNTIAYNKVLSTSDGWGAGIRTSGDSALIVVSHNDIFGNDLLEGIEGGGLAICSPSIIDSNYIHDNYAQEWRSALLVCDNSQPITITNNIVENNTGSGIRAINIKDVRIINNTIVGSGYRGVEVFNWPITSTVPFTFTMFNNIVINNGGCGINSENDANLLVDYNDIYEHSSNYCGFASPGVHDISADPRFVDPVISDYHLLPGSPAINAGDNSIAPAYDFDGVSRPQSRYVDMGAFEFIFNKIFMPVALK
jgi:hypothetical protein